MINKSIFMLLSICNIFTQIKSSLKKFKEANDAIAVMTFMFIGGIIMVIILVGIMILIIMNIEKIATAFLIFGVGLVAIVAALKLAERGFSWVKKT